MQKKVIINLHNNSCDLLSQNLFMNLMIAVFISLIIGCSSKGPKDRLSDNLNASFKSFWQDSLITKDKALFNRDIILKLYKRGGSILSTKWNSRIKIDQMISAIHNASQDGLNPYDYHLRDIESLVEKLSLSKKVKVNEVIRLELLLTDSFLLLAYHLSIGKTDPETIYPEWDITRRNTGLIWDKLIDSVLISKDIIEALQNLTPKHPDYYNLKKALAKYRLLEIQGGMNSFTTSMPKLEKGMKHPDVALLRKRLAAIQESINFSPLDEDLFDDSLKNQVCLFQKRNGLDPDGVAGKATIEALNIPVNERIQILESNLERWRWISDSLGVRYIRVNIAGFDLAVIENDRQLFRSLAVVGEPFKQTPVFSSMLKSIILNPDWNIPPDILKKEIIPEIKKNPDYLNKNNMKVVSVEGAEIENSSLIWDKVDSETFPYMIQQKAGPENALGRIEFSFPNKYFVYIHDTPFKNLFSQNSRALSHGCIRINKAFELAAYILKNQPEWDSVAIQKVIDQGATRIISLHNPIPVHILYLTAWADNDGTAYFGKDIYHRDSVLIRALDQIPPEEAKK